MCTPRATVSGFLSMVITTPSSNAAMVRSRQTAPDDEHVAVLECSRSYRRRWLQARSQQWHAGRIRDRGALSATGMPYRSAPTHPLRRRLGRIAAALRSAPRQPGNRAPRPGAPDKNARREDLLLLFLRVISVAYRGPLSPRLPNCARPTLRVVARWPGTSPPHDFPYLGCGTSPTMLKG